jgi:hypothetical protein
MAWLPPANGTVIPALGECFNSGARMRVVAVDERPIPVQDHGAVARRR